MNKNNTSHVVLLVILIVIAVAMIAFSYMKPSKIEYNTPSTNNQVKDEIVKPKEKPLTQEQTQLKQNIMDLVNKGKVLTKSEKDMIFQSISGSNINNYNFSKAERIKIVETLNKK